MVDVRLWYLISASHFWGSCDAGVTPLWDFCPFSPGQFIDIYRLSPHFGTFVNFPILERHRETKKAGVLVRAVLGCQCGMPQPTTLALDSGRLLPWPCRGRFGIFRLAQAQQVAPDMWSRKVV